MARSSLESPDAEPAEVGALLRRVSAGFGGEPRPVRKSPPQRRNWHDPTSLANDHHQRSEPVFKPLRTPPFFADTFRFNV